MKTVLKKNKIKGLIPSDFKTYCKAIVIKKEYGTDIRQINSPIEQNQEPRNKPIYIWSTNI